MYKWVFFFSSRRRHTRFSRDWSSDVCSSDLDAIVPWLVVQFPEGVARMSKTVMPWKGLPPARLVGTPPSSFRLGFGSGLTRSEERRVGKECEFRRSACRLQRQSRLGGEAQVC